MERMSPHLSLPEKRTEQRPRGREAISIISALSTQVTLMHRMAPERLQPYIGASDGQSEGIEDLLFSRWTDKYGRYFKEFCDDHADDEELIERIEEQILTASDVKRIEEFIQDPLRGGVFFTEAELDEFVKRQVH
jgi:hypothetical protein